MGIVEKQRGKFEVKTEKYEVKVHPQTNRMYHIVLAKKAIEGFLEAVKQADYSVQHLEYTPYARLIASSLLLEQVGEEFGEILRSIVHDRESGGFTIGLEGVTQDTDEYVIFSTAISYLLGSSNFDSMSGKYYARFTVNHTDNSDSYLRQAYRLFTLHTDGTFVDEPTDWLLMMKMVEVNARGGESRLLHLDDWKELDKYANHPLASHKFTYKAPSSKNVDQEVQRLTFFNYNNKPGVCFIDQFVYPETIEEATYLRDLSQSMENDDSVIELELPVGDLVVVNNIFWLHGRAAFEVNPNLNRELLRQRGRFNQ
ncbi:glutarate dioxygenase GlaH [Metabacillus sediminilitoris]|uniref:Carbon starvation induced protein CsiD n=1 Tax=Metabacillus sediminilitoris TaxID=2567941 RepID=A0A4S4BKE9_9BACI|nr:glutarate dioxygenase GlaH [Metabacillus sediminilitoris]QGQ45836.1 carbon starvation induced protein CsiD [Metabacillus sediminilitoris]THF75197.1 carbon starvation induced protein CsiD [Metabacillus sediminilitoris]